MSSHAKLTGKHQYVEFKEETIQGRVKKMVEMRDAITDVSDLHVRFSYGNRKTGANVPSVSLIPVADCGNCKMCAKGCYDIRNVCCYRESQLQRANNSSIYHRDPERFFGDVQAAVRFHRFFRYFVGGDIPDMTFLEEMVRIANVTPTCEFLCFTKMYDIVNQYIDGHGGGATEKSTYHPQRVAFRF